MSISSVISVLDKLDLIIINLERIAKALEANNNQKISTEKEKKRLFEGTTTKKAPQKECTTPDYASPPHTKLVPDGYHLEYYIDFSKPSCSAETTTLTWSAENSESIIK